MVLCRLPSTVPLKCLGYDLGGQGPFQVVFWIRGYIYIYVCTHQPMHIRNEPVNIEQQNSSFQNLGISQPHPSSKSSRPLRTF